MKLEFLFLGKTRSGYLAAGIEDYRCRLQRYTPVEVRVIREKNRGARVQVAKTREEDGDLLLAAVTRPAWVVILDRRGKSVSSEDLARLLQDWEEQGRPRISFLIGGPLGFNEGILGQADCCWSLSAMTFTHELARLLLLEQVYRAYTIRNGHEYHK